MPYKINTQEMKVIELIHLANKIIKLHEEKKFIEKNLSIFFDKFRDYILEKNNNNVTRLNHYMKNKLFRETQNADFYNEFQAASLRTLKTLRSGKYMEVTRLHSLHVMNYCVSFLSKLNNQEPLNYFKEEILVELETKERKLKQLQHRNDKNVKMFYHNAWRAEKLLYEKDFYSNMIFSRMAVEGFINYILDYYNIEINLTLLPKTTELINENVIEETILEELITVIRRGNNNAHEAFSGYYFSAKHNLDMLLILQDSIIGLLDKSDTEFINKQLKEINISEDTLEE